MAGSLLVAIPAKLPACRKTRRGLYVGGAVQFL